MLYVFMYVSIFRQHSGFYLVVMIAHLSIQVFLNIYHLQNNHCRAPQNNNFNGVLYKT